MWLYNVMGYVSHFMRNLNLLSILVVMVVMVWVLSMSHCAMYFQECHLMWLSQYFFMSILLDYYAFEKKEFLQPKVTYLLDRQIVFRLNIFSVKPWVMNHSSQCSTIMQMLKSLKINMYLFTLKSWWFNDINIVNCLPRSVYRNNEHIYRARLCRHLES